LLLLVATLLGIDGMKSAYDAALANDYRFLSFGDAMLILPDAA
jgi:S-adenosylmethionine:tRNA ribosyltransferase-isomerase